MCACLASGITEHSDLVARRLMTEYPILYRDTDSRSAIRDALIGACVTGDSLNRAFNPSRTAAPELQSAEHFADMLSVVLASEPDPDAPGFDANLYVDPLAEVADAWARWSVSLGEPSVRAKLMSLTCPVFADCGHPGVTQHAAEAVIGHYLPGLNDLFQAGHHWTDPFHGTKFQGVGSTVPATAGWREEILLALLAMLAGTHEGDDISHLHGNLIDLVGYDPLRHFDIAEFEEEFADRLNRSSDPLVAEYALLLRLVSGYVEAPTDIEAARYHAAALQARFDTVIGDPELPTKLDVVRAEAFEDVDEKRTFEQLRSDIEAFAQTSRHQLLIMCLGADGRQAYQDDLVDRVRRVCPLANQPVIEVITGVAMCIDADELTSELSEAELLAVLAELEEAYEFPTTSFTRYLAKVVKETGGGMPKAFLALALRNAQRAQQGIDDSVRDTTRLIAGVRVQLYVSGMGSTERARYLRIMGRLRQMGGEYTTLKAGSAPTVATGLGHVCSIFVAGVVVYKFFEDGAPTELASGVSQFRDILVGGAAIVQFADLVITTVFAKTDLMDEISELVALGGTWMSRMSAFVSFFTNAMIAVEYFTDEDYFGAVLLGVASVLNGVALICAFFPAFPPVVAVGAVAAAIAAILVLIDVVRKFAPLSPAQHALWNRVVGEHELLFTETVQVVAPISGDFTLTAALPVLGEVEIGDVGELVAFSDGAEGEPGIGYFDVDVDGGISAIHAAHLDLGGTLAVSCPIPAVASAEYNPSLPDGAVFGGDPLVTVRPRFESWVEARDAAFDDVSVDRLSEVLEGDEIAILGGRPVVAPHAGTVGMVEEFAAGAGLFGRIRIWATAP
jgi:hypothetical protein